MERGRKRKAPDDKSRPSLHGRGNGPGSRPASLENIQCKKGRTDSDSKSSPSRTPGRERRNASTTGSSTSSSSNSSNSSNSTNRKNKIGNRISTSTAINNPTTSNNPATSNNPSSSNIPATSNNPTSSYKPSSSNIPATSNNPTTSNKPSSSNNPAVSNNPTTSNTPTISNNPTTSNNPTISNNPTTSNIPSSSNNPLSDNRPSTSNYPTTSNTKRELKKLQDAWSSEVSPFRTRSHRGEQETPTKTSRRQIKFPEAETLTSSSSTSSSSGVGSSATSYTSSNSKTDSSSFLSSNSESYTSGKTSSYTTGSSTGPYSTSGTSDSSEASNQDMPGTSGIKNLSQINKFQSATQEAKYHPVSSSSNEEPMATKAKSSKKLRSRTLSNPSTDNNTKQNVPGTKINTRAHPKYSDSDSANESHSSNTSGTTPIKRGVGRPRTKHLSSNSKAKERELSSSSSSPFSKVVRSPQEKGNRTGEKTLGVSSNESTSTGDSELIRAYITSVSTQTPPRDLRSRDGSVATTSHTASIEGFCPEDKQATQPDRSMTREMIQSSPIRQTRSRNRSGDVAVDDVGVKVLLKRKPSRLMTILTSEHDNSQRGPHERDQALPFSLNTDTRKNNVERPVLIQVSDIVGGTESGTSNTKISNTDSASLRIVTSQESSDVISPSSTSVPDEDKKLGFDLNDFVIRRRRLRSESQQDELWEGLPSVTPFRKHASKLKDESECRYDTNTGDGVRDVNNPSSEPASSSNESLQQGTSSSTIGLISEIDSILSDTASSSCNQGHVSFEDVPSLEERTPEYSTCGASQVEAGSSSLQHVLDNDLAAAANDCLSELDTNVKSMFSSDITSCASTLISQDPSSPNEQQYYTDGSFSMNQGTRSSSQLTFHSNPGTPMPSGPESVWWSDKANSEGWATPVADPLAISPIASQSLSSDLETLPTETDPEFENCFIPKDEYDSLSNSCDAVDGAVFKEVMERKASNGQLEISAEIINSNLTTLTDETTVTSSDTNTSVSLTGDSGKQKSVRFMVTRSDCANIDSDTAKEVDQPVLQPTSSGSSKPESSSSSAEFLLWSKKKDKRKISFPKIVLRKCKESNFRDKERHSAQHLCDEGERPQLMTETDEFPATSECPSSGSTSLTPIKRSARLLKKVDSSTSGQCGRSTDFVYTPLKRDDNKTKTKMSTESPSPSKRRRRSSSDICQGEADVGADLSTDRNISDIDVTVLSPRQLRMQEREGREVVQSDSRHGLPLKARWKKKLKKNLKNKSGVLKKPTTSFEQRERIENQQTPSCLQPRKRKGPIIDEELLANPVIDKHACVLWSSEHRRHFQMSHPEASSAALDELLRRQWSKELTAQEKMKYFIRARDAVRDEDKHQPRSRGETKRGGRSGSGQKSTEEEDAKSSLEQFTRLKTKRQKDLLTKWLHFFQKVLSRQDYAKFIEEVKEGILEAEAQNKPNKTRGLTSKIFSHKKLLFMKMNSLKGHVMAQYHRRQHRHKELHKLAFYILVIRLIQGKPCSFIKGCRSKRLTGVLQDLRDLEYGDSIAVLGYPIPTNSFTDLYKEIVETVDSCMFREETPADDDLGNPETVSEVVDRNGSDATDAKETTTNPVLSQTCVEKKHVVSLLSPKSPVAQEPEWFDKPVSEQFMNRTVHELKNVTFFPQLHPRTLDSVFLPPPVRMPVYGAPSVGRSLLQRAQGQIQNRCTATPWMSGCRPAVSTTPRIPASHQSVREVMYADARDAFQRSFTSNTDPCCEMDSPSCVLSTWLVADKARK